MKTGNIKTWKRNSELVIMRNSYNSTVRYMVPKQCQYDCRKHVSTMQCRWSAVPLTSCIKYKRYVDAPKNDTIIQKPGSEHLEIQLLGSSTRGYAITHYKLTESDNARREDILTETEYVNDCPDMEWFTLSLAENDLTVKESGSEHLEVQHLVTGENSMIHQPMMLNQFRLSWKLPIITLKGNVLCNAKFLIISGMMAHLWCKHNIQTWLKEISKLTFFSRSWKLFTHLFVQSSSESE